MTLKTVWANKGKLHLKKKPFVCLENEDKWVSRSAKCIFVYKYFTRIRKVNFSRVKLVKRLPLTNEISEIGLNNIEI